jgi:cell division protein FtsI/penicillin-binding protein 2
VSRRRLLPLYVVFALVAAVLITRLFEIQVREHPVWAREAARLVRKGEEQPYRRGRILDANGTVLASDEERREVELVYRDFRREHPLGQVCHARSLLEGRPIPLPEALANLRPWAEELVQLGPREIAAFARGTRERKPRGVEPRQLARRAGDLFFYLPRLLGFSPQERGPWTALMGLLRGAGESRSLLELAALVRHGSDVHGVARESAALEERLARHLARLDVLAHWLRPVDDGGRTPLAALVAELEDARRLVEDATAAKLFAEATGFAPGRIASDTLLDCFDHSWITALLGWDRARLSEWAATVRTGWLERWRDGECLPALFVSLASDPTIARSPADFLARLAVAYRPEGALAEALETGPRPWREVEELAVFSELEEGLEADVPEKALALGREALPLQLASLRADPDEERLLPAGDGPDSFRALLARRLAEPRLDLEGLLELARTECEIWELRYQETLRGALDLTRRSAARRELGAEGGLRLSGAGRERALERAEYFLKDYGSRPRTLSEGALSYDVVYLLTRYAEDFPGFRVRALETRARVEFEGDDRRPADRLIGFVAAPTLDERLRQRREEAALRALRDDPDLDEDEAEELLRLVGRVRLPTQARGVLGVEAFLDPELTGQNGYSLTRGLSEASSEASEALVREPVDGADVFLTLDVGLQCAAQRALRSPSAHEDEDWARAPVGAIVLLDTEGNVLAAASEPDDQSHIDEFAQGQRLIRSERTLKKPTFQPPGSVFKPFVAAWALDHGLDPTHAVVCGPIARGGFGYKDLRCTKQHGAVDLHSALVQSCNAYFAWLGETLSTADFAELAARFGFGEPSGVRRAPDAESAPRRRLGLSEDVAVLALPKDDGEWSDSSRRRAGNGLQVVEATPMQLARATLALLRGEKRELRLVERVGTEVVRRSPPVPLGLDERSLEFVRSAMRGVTEEAHGTAANALSFAQLGFSVAAKTGSADLESAPDDAPARVRKHAWVAGWAPADNPRLVFVVFEHGTQATSHNGAVFLARDLLRQSEVLAWLDARRAQESAR